jgi:hypothetical protein
MGGKPQSRDAWIASSITVAHILLQISAWKAGIVGKLDGSRCRFELIALRINMSTEVRNNSLPTGSSKIRRKGENPPRDKQLQLGRQGSKTTPHLLDPMELKPNP